MWLAGRPDRHEKGMNGLALQVQQALVRDPHAGDLYVFRGARGDLNAPNGSAAGLASTITSRSPSITTACRTDTRLGRRGAWRYCDRDSGAPQGDGIPTGSRTSRSEPSSVLSSNGAQEARRIIVEGVAVTNAGLASVSESASAAIRPAA